jgi:hypothetical protein
MTVLPTPGGATMTLVTNKTGGRIGGSDSRTTQGALGQKPSGGKLEHVLVAAGAVIGGHVEVDSAGAGASVHLYGTV